ncbi:hypothetical protein AQUCO_00700433v1 [Aquilegia coerulea]|uniref:Rubisco LSMT substrate-binding domain-containing protein n=1 Tax=Aquilegia coerulea TaxID=218851 RepID=A0A2G5EK33_AQUCA|nr:hypothetical protein AQUCO_00700433v1 [Aquilegia coerulea]
MGKFQGSIFDFLNHDGDSEAVLLIDEDKQISEVIADQDYTPGKQVLVSYGKYPNSTLILDFGFTLSYNNCDQVQIQMISPQHDPLRNLKLELVHKHSAPLVTDSISIDPFQNSFIIKEVRSSRGKGKGIPQSLRAFARILCTDTFEELKDLELEAVQTDGRLARRPLKNISREIQSHQLLLSLITHLIQDYDASIKSLKLLRSHCTGGNFALRRQMALDLLSGELRILRSASAWLDNYCSSLSNETAASEMGIHVNLLVPRGSI